MQSEATDEFMMTEETEREEFHQEDLPLEGFPVMDQIRSEGRLCDIKLKVRKCGLLERNISYNDTVLLHTSMTQSLIHCH